MIDLLVYSVIEVFCAVCFELQRVVIAVSDESQNKSVMTQFHVVNLRQLVV